MSGSLAAVLCVLIICITIFACVCVNAKYESSLNQRGYLSFTTLEPEIISIRDMVRDIHIMMNVMYSTLNADNKDEYVEARTVSDN